MCPPKRHICRWTRIGYKLLLSFFLSFFLSYFILFLSFFLATKLLTFLSFFLVFSVSFFLSFLFHSFSFLSFFLSRYQTTNILSFFLFKFYLFGILYLFNGVPNTVLLVFNVSVRNIEWQELRNRTIFCPIKIRLLFGLYRFEILVSNPGTDSHLEHVLKTYLTDVYPPNRYLSHIPPIQNH